MNRNARSNESGDPATIVGMAQALYFLVTGVWPWISMRSFTAITGPKKAWWLVKTVGALVTVIGATIGLAAWRRRITPEIGFLAVGSAGSLALVDLLYVAKGRIPPVYLLDMLAELLLIVGWLVAGRPRRQARKGDEYVHAGD